MCPLHTYFQFDKSVTGHGVCVLDTVWRVYTYGIYFKV